jgi:hypothetical protein
MQCIFHAPHLEGTPPTPTHPHPPWTQPHTTHAVSLLRRVRVLCPPEIGSRLDNISTPQQALELLASHSSSDLGFLQFFNLHRSQPDIQQLVRDPCLAGTAAQLLVARRVRLYQVGVSLKMQGLGLQLCPANLQRGGGGERD